MQDVERLAVREHGRAHPHRRIDARVEGDPAPVFVSLSALREVLTTC